MTKLGSAVVATIVMIATSVASAETIEQLVSRSVAQYLAQLRQADLAEIPLTVASFTKVRDHINPQPLVMLKVALPPWTDVAMTDGRSVVVTAAAEHYSELERQFIFAHEIGHIVLAHKKKRLELYQKYHPGDVTEQALTNVERDPVFNREMMELAHRSEYEADSFAIRTLVSLGWNKDDVIHAFLGMARTPSTMTHPATYKRALNMRNTPTEERK